MTTKYQYRSYNINTHKHVGTFPNIFWESAPINLYGGEGITATISIFPIGSESSARGKTTAFVTLNYKGPSVLSVEIDVSISIRGSRVATRSGRWECGDRGSIPFGTRKGWHIDSSDSVLESGAVDVGFIVTIRKITKYGIGCTQTIIPKGECLYELISKI
jgi:hypothetical protein